MQPSSTTTIEATSGPDSTTATTPSSRSLPSKLHSLPQLSPHQQQILPRRRRGGGNSTSHGEEQMETSPLPPREMEPLPLHPLRPISRAQRVRRHIRSDHGSKPARILRVLEGHPPSSPSYPCPAITSYVIDSVICQQPNTGASLLMATPLVPRHGTTTGNENGSAVVCRPQVVIKAVPRDNRQESLMEIGAMQLCDQNRNDEEMKGGDGDSSHVIRLLDVLEDEEYTYLVMPYLAGGDMFKRVDSNHSKGLSEDTAAGYLRQIAKGLRFLKSAGIAHHDVSLENVMCSDKGQDHVTIIDLGMSLRTPSPARGEANSSPIHLTPQRCRGKAGYVSPEVVNEEACDPYACDVWSLGVMAYAMMTGRPLYNSPEDPAFTVMARGGIKQVVEVYETYGLHMSDTAKDLIYHMLHSDPTKRFTLEEVLLHPFLSTLTVGHCFHPAGSGMASGSTTLPLIITSN